ncbi:MAG: DUF1385 domain-containing protein [Clostridia bacterium]|nr:DUF1385 domain-containing protein [Clostridia bacterium]
MARTVRTPVYAQPVAEGARFCVGSATAFAVRRREKDIALRIRRERRPLRRAVSRMPFARGMQRLLLCTFGLIDGLSESAELDPQHIARGTRPERSFARLFRLTPEGLVGFLSGIMIPILLVAFLCGVPLAVEKLVLPNFELSGRWVNAIMCVSRILGGWIGLILCGRLRVVNRLCMYRGAINKVLNAYEENRREPTLAEAIGASRRYHKSDAAFLLVVMALSIVAFTMIRTFTLPVQLLVRVLTVLVVAGVVNEPIQALERLKPKNPLSKLLAPYLWLGRWFVIEPHDQMVEVALCAFNAARENDQ